MLIHNTSVVFRYVFTIYYIVTKSCYGLCCVDKRFRFGLFSRLFGWIEFGCVLDLKRTVCFTNCSKYSLFIRKRKTTNFWRIVVETRKCFLIVLSSTLVIVGVVLIVTYVSYRAENNQWERKNCRSAFSIYSSNKS